jgi:hypothetical protein
MSCRLVGISLLDVDTKIEIKFRFSQKYFGIYNFYFQITAKKINFFLEFQKL